MVICRIIGGLGNQFFQYAAARQLALTFNVPFMLDVSKYTRSPNRKYLLDHYQVVTELVGPHDIEEIARRRNDRGWRRLTRLFGFTPPGSIRFFREKLDRINRLPNPVRRTVYLNGYWQREHYFNSIADKIREELRPREAPRPVVQALVDEVESVPSVAVHLRRGDYASNPTAHRTFSVCPGKYYEQAASILSRYEGDHSYFVFSDDLDWARASLPFLKPVSYVDIGSARRDLDDFEVMSRCRHFIIANSTFSWWAAWLGRHPDKRVVAPRHWYTDERRNTNDRYPAKWEVVDWT